MMSSALKVTMKKRDRNSFVALNLFYILWGCRLEATSLFAAYIRHLFLYTSNHSILHILTKY